MRIAVALLLVLVAAVPALADEPEPYVRRCGTSQFGDLGQGWQERAVVAGHVAFVGMSERWRPGGPGVWPAKVIVVADPNASPTVTIAERSRKHAALGYNKCPPQRHRRHARPGDAARPFRGVPPGPAPRAVESRHAVRRLLPGRRPPVRLHRGRDPGQDHPPRPPFRRAAVPAVNDARRLIRRARSEGRDPEARRRAFARSRARLRRS